MKVSRILLSLALACAVSVNAPAQNLLKSLGNRAKNAVENRITTGTNRAIQKGLDKVEDAAENAVQNSRMSSSRTTTAPAPGSRNARRRRGE